MALFIINLEVISASNEEVDIYYETAAKKINLLLEKYNICNTEGQIEQVSTEQLKAVLAFPSFFQATPLKSIFFDSKQQYVPLEIVDAFRSIISDPPKSIKAIFLNTFINLLMKKGWDKSLSAYFEKEYNFPSNGIIILDDLKDFSLGIGVYRTTFLLRTPRKEKIVLFLKELNDVAIYNEILYFELQKELLLTAQHAQIPCMLSDSQNEGGLLLSPLVPGMTSDTTLSILIQTYMKCDSNTDKIILKKALEILIESFIDHAVLGDLLGRNDRHLMNSFIAPVVDGVVQPDTSQDSFSTAEKILTYAKNITMNKDKAKAISLIDIDLKWLLEKKNSVWSLVDIDFGLSELNLLSLLPEFNDYDPKKILLFEKRREYIVYYFNFYCQRLKTLLEKKELLFSAVRRIYPSGILEEKLNFFTQRVHTLEKSKEPVFELFKRYLLNFRTRLIYKQTLAILSKTAEEANNQDLLDALKRTNLSKYLPPQSFFITNTSSIFLQLQCFRGVLSKEHMIVLSEENGTSWETVASNISILAEKFNDKLFNKLEDKKRFIEEDSAALLVSISHSESISQDLKTKDVLPLNIVL